MSTSTVSSTQQQDQVARSNSAQMRKHSADQKASQGPSAFADLLQQATEPTEADSADLLLDDSDRPDAQAPTDPSEWLALTQAYSASRTADKPTADTTASGATPPAADAGEIPTDPLARARSADGEPVPELDTEARAEAAGANPRRTPSRGAVGATGTTTPSTAGLGAPATRDDTGTAANFGTIAQAASVVLPGGAALPLARTDTPARATPGGLPAAGTTEDSTAPLPAGAERVQAARNDAGAPQTDVQTGGDGTAPSERSHHAEAPQPDATPWAEQWGEAMEDVGHQISYWLGKGVKQAQIQVEAGLDRPLEVAVSLDKGQAVLHFQTDSASARAAIESGAAEALRDALARDGIGLAGLSVGSQDRQNPSGEQPQGGRRAWGVAGAEASGPTETVSLTRPASNRVLDLYA